MGLKLGEIPMVVVVAILISGCCGAVEAVIGVNFGRIADDLPSPADVAKLVKSQGISKVKIYDADNGILSAFAGTGVSVAIMVPNEIIQNMASNPAAAQNWISTNVGSFFPATTIDLVMVGNEILTKAADPTIASFLPQAMKNIYAALQSSNMSSSIKVTTPHAFDVLDAQSSFPPSSGAFKQSLMSTMSDIVQFLIDTNSCFMIDVYPYFAYRDDSAHISLDYALFNPNAISVSDSNTGLGYSNLFDAQLDAVIAALGRLGGSQLPIVVSETGWPSAGDPGDNGATVENAATYNQNLVSHVTQNPPRGTPMRPGVAIDTYIFELFNEDQKTGSLSERHFGLFYPNMTKVGRLSPLPVFPTTTSYQTDPIYSGADRHSQYQSHLQPVSVLLVLIFLVLGLL